MTTIQINEKTKIGRNLINMIKSLAQIEQDKSIIRFLDETEYLLSTKANRDVLLHGVEQVENNHPGKIIDTSDLWK